MQARRRRVRFSIRAVAEFCVGLLFVVVIIHAGNIAWADSGTNADDINARLYERLDQRLDGSSSAGKIKTVSGQLYIPKEHIESTVINDALALMLDQSQGSDASVALRRGARLNFEIHFKKNSAELTEEARKGLDQLGEVLASEYLETRFVIGGHTDLDGDDEINGPLSQARAESARAYLVRTHSIALDRIVATGFGSSEPLREVEGSAEDKLYNRRVDLRPIRSGP